MKKIIFTGGGSAGHVMVNTALIPLFQEAGWSTSYIGSIDGIEREIITNMPNIAYHPIATGKLRRYLDVQNMKDPFKVMKGIVEAYRLIKKEKPQIVFSKGGFVSLPVVIAAWLRKIPVVIHESDITPGLANKLASPFATVVCTTFPESMQSFAAEKCQLVGPVIREELKAGSEARGQAFVGWTNKKPTILVMGGSLGSKAINTIVRQALAELTASFQVIHLCGKGQIDETIFNPSYRQYEYVSEQLPDIMKLSDLVVSRAGSNAIFEFLYLKIPMLLIPLTKKQSRGDQLLNAASFEREGYCQVIEEEQLTHDSFIHAVHQMYQNRDLYVQRMEQYKAKDALTSLFQIIANTAKKAEQK